MLQSGLAPETLSNWSNSIALRRVAPITLISPRLPADGPTQKQERQALRSLPLLLIFEVRIALRATSGNPSSQNLDRGLRHLETCRGVSPQRGGKLSQLHHGVTRKLHACLAASECGNAILQKLRRHREERDVTLWFSGDFCSRGILAGSGSPRTARRRLGRATGLEPATSGSTIQRSNQLSYARRRAGGLNQPGGGVKSGPQWPCPLVVIPQNPVGECDLPPRPTH